MYAVVGATGNSGSVVAKELLARGQKVRAIGRTADRLQSLRTLGGEPFVADITDRAGLERAFAGARAAYVMLPSDVRSEDVLGYSERVTDSVTSAIEKTRLQYAVALSSIGADKKEGTGSVAALSHLL